MQESSRVNLKRRLCEYRLSLTTLRGCVFVQCCSALFGGLCLAVLGMYKKTNNKGKDCGMFLCSVSCLVCGFVTRPLVYTSA